jgi:hypothetical protein
MDYKLHIFKHDAGNGWLYHFAVVDKAKSYPANFICMLPSKPAQIKPSYSFGGKFGTIFGEKSKDIAVKLLNDALKSEEETEIKAEITKRLNLLDPQLLNTVICSQCKKQFQAQKSKKRRRYLCSECLEKRYKSPV